MGAYAASPAEQGTGSLVTAAAAQGRRARHSRAMSAFARFGLGARAFVYIVVGWLALQIAFGHAKQQANQRGALADVAQQSFGIILLWILGIGFAAYAIWRLSEAAFGTAAAGDDAGARVQSLVRGIVYVSVAVSTFLFIAGQSKQGQSQQQQSTTAKLMKQSYGRWLVGIIGLVVVVVGVAMVIQGARRKFEKDLEMSRITGSTRTIVVRLGQIGTIARGAVFAAAGGLTVDSAVTYDPSKSRGLDGALRTLAAQSYGPWLLGAAALGLIAFGIYGFAAARWAKT